MRLQRWLSTSASLGFLLLAPQFVLAQAAGQPAAAASDQLPKECVVAGAKTKQECDDFLKKAAAKGPTVDNAPVTTAADSKAATGTPLPKDCVDAGLKTQADCDA